MRSVSRIIQPITFADRVKDLILGCNAAEYKFYDEKQPNHEKFLIQVENKIVKFNEQLCTVTYFKDVTNRVYEGQQSIQSDFIKILVKKLKKLVLMPME